MPTYATITSNAASFKIAMNDLAPLPNINTDKISYRRASLVQVQKEPQLSYLVIILSVGVVKREWTISLDGNTESLPITSINGTTPTDLDHLYDLVEGLMV